MVNIIMGMNVNSTYLIDKQEVTANIVYKETKISKQQFLNVFGQDGTLTIKSSNGIVLANINNNTQTDGSGNISIKYPDQTKNIVITASKPIAIGTLNIEHTKTILSTGYQRETINKFTGIKESIKINNVQKESLISLKDTETLASLKIKNLSKKDSLIKNFKKWFKEYKNGKASLHF